MNIEVKGGNILNVGIIEDEDLEAKVAFDFGSVTVLIDVGNVSVLGEVLTALGTVGQKLVQEVKRGARTFEGWEGI